MPRDFRLVGRSESEAAATSTRRLVDCRTASGCSLDSSCGTSAYNYNDSGTAIMPHSPPKLHDENRKRGRPMRLMAACCSVSIALAVFGCSSTPAVNLPLSVGNGAGSRDGNYAAQMDGEMRGSSGERCVIFNWDHPFAKGISIVYRPHHANPRSALAGWSARKSPAWSYRYRSNLKDEQDEARR